MRGATSRVSAAPLLTLVIGQAGHGVAIYDDAWAFTQLGKINISRASHVEPDATGSWLADLSPVGGPLLGPFTLRADALAAERAWLTRHLHQLPRTAGE